MPSSRTSCRHFICLTEDIDYTWSGDLFLEGQHGNGRQLVEHVFWRGPNKLAPVRPQEQSEVVEGWEVDSIEKKRYS